MIVAFPQVLQATSNTIVYIAPPLQAFRSKYPAKAAIATMPTELCPYSEEELILLLRHIPSLTLDPYLVTTASRATTTVAAEPATTLITVGPATALIATCTIIVAGLSWTFRDNLHNIYLNLTRDLHSIVPRLKAQPSFPREPLGSHMHPTRKPVPSSPKGPDVHSASSLKRPLDSHMEPHQGPVLRSHKGPVIHVSLP